MKTTSTVLSFLLGLGFLAYGSILVWERYTPLPESQVASQTASGRAQIDIPSARIILPIYPATITDNRWEITKSGVSYLSTSPKPGARGNSVLYGHNWPRLLGRLTLVKPGDAVLIKGEDGKVVRFIVTYVFTVRPDQTEIFADTSDSRITIYTCTGFLDSKRLVVTALRDLSVL